MTKVFILKREPSKNSIFEKRVIAENLEEAVKIAGWKECDCKVKEVDARIYLREEGKYQ